MNLEEALKTIQELEDEICDYSDKLVEVERKETKLKERAVELEDIIKNAIDEVEEVIQTLNNII